MKLGKLTTDELNKNVISLLHKNRSEVLLSSAIGEDCAALDLKDVIVVSSDPITAVVEKEKLGALCVSVCCNDVAANGGEPVAMTITLIMPPSSSAEDVSIIMRGAVKRADELNVDIVGGHTEFSDCVVRPVACGTAFGKTGKLISKAGLKQNDLLYVTKKLALEGTCILADILKPELDKTEKDKLALFNSQLDVLPESMLLRSSAEVSMMHDVTEGGILGAVAEVCFLRQTGAEIYEDKMPFDPLTLKLCARAGVDPLRLISSGSMLVAVSDPEKAEKAMKTANIEFTCIGKVTGKDVVLVRKDGTREKIDVLADEMYKFSGESK